MWMIVVVLQKLVHTQDCGQVSINISRPGITKGQHWHNSKWELFIVVAGHGLIQDAILIQEKRWNLK